VNGRRKRASVGGIQISAGNVFGEIVAVALDCADRNKVSARNPFLHNFKGFPP
jgi:hypothetical protein